MSTFLSLGLFVEDQALNSLFLDKSEYLSSMYARSMEGNNVDGRFILTVSKQEGYYLVSKKRYRDRDMVHQEEKGYSSYLG